jgi:hypothetical protein
MRKNKKRGVTEVVYADDEDDKVSGKQQPGRPNAYFAKIKQEQEEELEEQEKGDTFGGAFRGVRPAPHGGAMTVRPDQVKGAEELCWCGQVLGHDWPGKNVGAKHPKVKEGSMNTTEYELDRRGLRAYHKRLQDFIMTCIKDDGLKWRQAKNSIILYPPDDSTPITVYARNTDRQIRQLQKWYLDHVYVEPEKEPATEEQIAALAKAVNSPEHPVEEKPAPPEPPVGLVDTDLPAEEPKVEAEAPVAPPVETVRSNDQWVPYIHDDGSESVRIETNGTQFRCRECLTTDHPLLSENRRSIGGHNRMWHTDSSTMHTPEARAKAIETGRYNRTKDRMIEVLVPLLESVGYEAEADPKQIKALEKQVTDLTRQVGKLETDLTATSKRADDAEARLKLMQEAFRGLE